MTTPETYLGAARAERFTNPMLSPGSHDFAHPAETRANEFAYHGNWKIALDSATAGEGAALDLNFGARRVYLVLGSPGHAAPGEGAARRQANTGGRAGSDVHEGAVTVPPSASTTWSNCRRSATTCSRWNPRQG